MNDVWIAVIFLRYVWAVSFSKMQDKKCSKLKDTKDIYKFWIWNLQNVLIKVYAGSYLARVVL